MYAPIIDIQSLHNVIHETVSFYQHIMCDFVEIGSVLLPLLEIIHLYLKYCPQYAWKMNADLKHERKNCTKMHNILNIP